MNLRYKNKRGWKPCLEWGCGLDCIWHYIFSYCHWTILQQTSILISLHHEYSDSAASSSSSCCSCSSSNLPLQLQYSSLNCRIILQLYVLKYYTYWLLILHSLNYWIYLKIMVGYIGHIMFGQFNPSYLSNLLHIPMLFTHKFRLSSCIIGIRSCLPHMVTCLTLTLTFDPLKSKHHFLKKGYGQFCLDCLTSLYRV